MLGLVLAAASSVRRIAPCPHPSGPVFLRTEVRLHRQLGCCLTNRLQCSASGGALSFAPGFEPLVVSNAFLELVVQNACQG